ncbi:protection of telomeres protein 1 isoform X1 [Leucoraja erinacea]|uniref:protection of telomeres protein 1 isoform X1 n=1 Tax=Leucoraja erinaceus TaxID=7782 RepID=UPI002457674D|nr:protection of telomeres protein 1 isoform X1 [Leucoraja erinacea]
MPLQQLRDADGPVETQMSGCGEWIEYDKLQLESAPINKYIKGTILMKYPPHELGTGEKVLKIVLEESTTQPSTSNQASINTFIFGKLVDDCESILKQGDTVVLTNFQASKSPSASKDGRHAFQLELSDEEGATVFVCCKTGPESAAIIRKTKVVMQDYTYAPLNTIKDGVTVNVYGVVKFFKQPYRSKGTDYCMTVTIVDPTGAKLHCVIFNGNADHLPKIYRTGDVVRFHRVKIQEFNSELQAISAPGFSVLTFDGALGVPATPRASSKSYHFTATDLQMVEDLRRWANANTSTFKTTVTLADVKAAEYFDLTCQLVAKGVVDRSAVMLKVWDGTKCPHTLKDVPVDRSALEGDASEITRLGPLTVDVLTYDNHTATAKSLKPGTYLRICNLHAKLAVGSSETRSGCPGAAPKMEFHLHGGTTYGRGIMPLPTDCEDVRQLKRSLESALSSDQDSMEDLTLLDVLNSSSGPSASEEISAGCVERCQQESRTVLTAHQHISPKSLGEVLHQTAPRKHRIRAKLVNYEPRALHQSVKLYCPHCRSLQEVPGDDDLDTWLLDAGRAGAGAGSCSEPHDAGWYETTVWEQGDQRRRQITVRFVKTNRLRRTPERSTILVEGVSLNELYQFSETFGNIIPTATRPDDLVLNDLSIPFLIQDGSWHYGCRRCSDPRPVSVLQSLTQDDTWESSAIAKALGIQQLSYVFVMKFTLDDGSGSLDAFLWDEAEKFFGISAADVMISEVLQEKLTRIMNTLCPPKTSPEDYPWLECCLKSYYVGEGLDQKTCYQVFDSTVAGLEDI